MAFYICGFAHQKGEAGRCTPGDEHCNNYCNMAPQKGSMKCRPKELEPEGVLSVAQGELAQLRERVAAKEIEVAQLAVAANQAGHAQH